MLSIAGLRLFVLSDTYLSTSKVSLVYIEMLLKYKVHGLVPRSIVVVMGQ